LPFCIIGTFKLRQKREKKEFIAHYFLGTVNAGNEKILTKGYWKGRILSLDLIEQEHFRQVNHFLNFAKLQFKY
jgi:hypothetical protein